MTGKRATLLLLLIAGLAGSPAPGAAWELVTHQRVTDAAMKTAITTANLGIDRTAGGETRDCC
jgi:hypothetical protein